MSFKKIVVAIDAIITHTHQLILFILLSTFLLLRILKKLHTNSTIRIEPETATISLLFNVYTQAISPIAKIPVKAGYLFTSDVLSGEVIGLIFCKVDSSKA